MKFKAGDKVLYKNKEYEIAIVNGMGVLYLFNEHEIAVTGEDQIELIHTALTENNININETELIALFKE